MEKYSITVASDFSNTLGGRWKALGDYSGEEFYETKLLPIFDEAFSHDEKLHIYLDGAMSYPRSFLDQSFGELARKRGLSNVCNTIIFHTNNFIWVIDYLKNHIWKKE